MLTQLSDLEVGATGTISDITASGIIKRRFMDMGLVKGTTIHITKLAPLGNPIQISLKGYDLCIRKEDAKYITIAI